METSPNKAAILSEEEKSLISGFSHVKVIACQDESAPESSMLLFFLMCVYVHAGVFTHLHVACESQKILSGVPNHFPFYLLKQGLLLH